MLGAVSRRRLDAKAEFRAQIEKILQAGIKPTHLDTHKHTHLFPPVLDAVAALSREYGIHWVRRPFDFPLSGAEKAIVPGLKQATSRGLQFLRRHVHARLARDGCRTTDHFAGFQITGRFQSGQLTSLIRNLPEGSTEFMCHPGFCTDELRQAQTRLKESREMELRAITDPEVRNVLSEQNVHLVNYRGL
jgi:predicted glycoside hydrolase/deacetylase ChbG (UPF0249 family)